MTREHAESIEQQIEALKLSRPKMFNHPERADDEVWLTNDPDPKAPWCVYKTKRSGKDAFEPESGQRAAGFFPIFVSVREYLERNSTRADKF